MQKKKPEPQDPFSRYYKIKGKLYPKAEIDRAGKEGRQEWEKEFDAYAAKIGILSREEIIIFFRRLITSHTAKLKEEVGKMIRTRVFSVTKKTSRKSSREMRNESYNQALSDVLRVIEGIDRS